MELLHRIEDRLKERKPDRRKLNTHPETERRKQQERRNNLLSSSLITIKTGPAEITITGTHPLYNDGLTITATLSVIRNK